MFAVDDKVSRPSFALFSEPNAIEQPQYDFTIREKYIYCFVLPIKSLQHRHVP